MDLKEFTKETLIQIVQGVKEANDSLEQYGACVPGRTLKSEQNVYVDKERTYANAFEVDFDVAVTATETDGTKGGGGLRVAQLFQAGIEANRSTENQSISRVKFTLPLVLEK